MEQHKGAEQGKECRKGWRTERGNGGSRAREGLRERATRGRELRKRAAQGINGAEREGKREGKGGKEEGVQSCGAQNLLFF